MRHLNVMREYIQHWDLSALLTLAVCANINVDLIVIHFIML